ncbi:hypothetical protein [Solicola sp. PLA-1-18]|uniref:hypothetical protein n=1 Tax=Solicola sp. PLA-1-18 TaxID=3380532 RepID=UPI003B77A653
MTKIKDQTNTDSVERMLDDLDPATVEPRDATHFRRLIRARERLEADEIELRAAVASARAAGDSWTVIGAALDISRQAAQQRFGEPRTRLAV